MTVPTGHQPGQGAGIDNRLGAEYRSVHRDDFTGSHDHDVAYAYLFGRYLLHLVVDPRLSDLGRPLNESRQLPSRPRRGDVLERRASREHDPDDQPSELFAERKRPHHRHQGDRVHAHVAVYDDRADDSERQLGGEQRDGGPPDVVPGRAGAGEM